MFKEARRLKPAEDLWDRIAARSELSSAMRRDASRAKAPLRAAAVLTLAAGLAGLLFQQTRPHSIRSAAAAGAGGSEIVDPELLTWHSGLGEFDSKSDLGFPFTDNATGDDWLTGSVAEGEEGESL